MPLLYHDAKQPRSTSFRTPSFLAPWAGELQRAEAATGDIVGLWNPLIFSPAQLPPDQVWHEIEDGWRLALIGDPVPRAWLTTAADRPRLLPVTDGFGRDWHAPAILSPRDEIALPMQLKLDEVNQWTRVPTSTQAALITAARNARAEWLTLIPGDQEGMQVPRMTTVPIQVCADWAATLLACLYPLSPRGFSALGLLSDDLVRNVLLASTGCLKV